MTKKTRMLRSLSTSLFIGVAISASAQEISKEDAFRILLRNYVGNAQTVDNLRTNLMRRFDKLDSDGTPGLSAHDYEFLGLQKQARQRASFIQRKLGFDLNGDISISEEEILPFARVQASAPLRSGKTTLRPTEEQKREIITDYMDKFFVNDTNGDRILSFDEIVAEAEAQTDTKTSRSRSQRREFVSELDADGDGSISRDELNALFDAVVGDVDTNRDGIISEAEKNSFVLGVKKIQRPAVDPAAQVLTDLIRQKCTMAAVPKGAVVAIVGGYEGSGVATSHLGIKPSVTHVVDLEIPKEGPPIYLIVSFNSPTIIRVSGGKERITVGLSVGRSLGFVGIDPRQLKVSGNAAIACKMNMWVGAGGHDPNPKAYFAKVLGQEAAFVVTDYTIGKVDLGAQTNQADELLKGSVKPKYDGAANSMLQKFARFNPGGLIEISPESVTTTAAVAAHKVLPQEAGLAALIESGALIRSGQQADEAKIVLEDEHGAIRIGSKTFRPGAGDDAITMGKLVYTEEAERKWVGRLKEEYLITRQITLPIGLLGSHSVDFILPKGVPYPKGDVGHSEVKELDWDANEK